MGKPWEGSQPGPVQRCDMHRLPGALGLGVMLLRSPHTQLLFCEHVSICAWLGFCTSLPTGLDHSSGKRKIKLVPREVDV